MKLTELLPIVQDEKRSEEYLYSLNILKTFSKCPRCNSLSIGIIRGRQWICHNCNYEWTKRRDSILSLTRIRYSDFILCLKFFELEITAERTAIQLDINYKTVLLLFRSFRSLIASKKIKSQSDEKIILKKDIETIGIIYEQGRYYFDIGNTNRKNIAELNLHRNRVPNSAAIYEASIKIIKTTETQSLFNLAPSLQHFIRYAKEKLFMFRGTDKNYLELYLREIEFRFNNSPAVIYVRLCSLISENFVAGEL